MKLWPEGSQTVLPIRTLVLPAATRENVGELVADVLISTYELQRVGCIESDYVLPAAGNDPYVCTRKSAGQLTTSLELFVAKDGAFHVLQQRAPVAPGAQTAFAAELAAWLLEHAVEEVIVVSGLPSTFRHDPSQPIGSQYLSNSGRTQEACSSLGWRRLDHDVEKEEKAHHSLLAPWPTIAALEGSSIAFTLASMYVNEGNNLPAAQLLTGELVKLLTSQQLLQEPARQLRQPCSWASVFGGT